MLLELQNTRTDYVTDDVDTIAQKVFHKIQKMENTLGERKPDTNSVHYKKIRCLVSQNLPIKMILPAFPAKSPNPLKTSGTLPDYGEWLALQNLQMLCNEIDKIYLPGAQVIICSDGRVFNDLVQVTDENVEKYNAEICKIIASFNFRSLTTFDLDDVYPELNYMQRREKLTASFGKWVNYIREQSQTETQMQNLFNGIHRFVFEDQIVLRPEVSRSQARKYAKEIAYQVIQRSNAWSALLENIFPDTVRLSIHPQSADSKKFGIKLLPSEDIWRTPWHSVAVLRVGGKVELLPLGQLESQRFEKRFAFNRFVYFCERES